MDNKTILIIDDDAAFSEMLSVPPWNYLAWVGALSPWTYFWPLIFPNSDYVPELTAMGVTMTPLAVHSVWTLVATYGAIQGQQILERIRVGRTD